MSIQPDPPIQLDPSMDNGHQLAFINQNFQSIANFLKVNSFKIVLSSSTTITVPNPQGTDFSSSSTVTHNLGYIPAYLAYVIPPSTYTGSLRNVLVPFLDYVIFDSANPPNIAGWHINGRGDVTLLNTTTIKFGLFFTNNFGNTPGIWTFKYYLLQETAN